MKHYQRFIQLTLLFSFFTYTKVNATIMTGDFPERYYKRFSNKTLPGYKLTSGKRVAETFPINTSLAHVVDRDFNLGSARYGDLKLNDNWLVTETFQGAQALITTEVSAPAGALNMLFGHAGISFHSRPFKG